MITLAELEHAAAPFGLPGRAYRDRSWDGHTLREKTYQSFLCHPDWNADTHRVYLVVEEPFSPVAVHEAPIEKWLESWA